MRNSAAHERSRAVPVWMWYSLLTLVLWGVWGVQSKIIVDRISPLMNQVLFVLGLLPPLLFVMVAARKRLGAGANRRKGAVYAYVTGVLGGLGNIAFYQSLAGGGKASIVVPITCLFPVVTVLLAITVLHESITRAQMAGLGLAIVAIYLLSV